MEPPCYHPLSLIPDQCQQLFRWTGRLWGPLRPSAGQEGCGRRKEGSPPPLPPLGLGALLCSQCSPPSLQATPPGWFRLAGLGRRWPVRLPRFPRRHLRHDRHVKSPRHTRWRRFASGSESQGGLGGTCNLGPPSHRAMAASTRPVSAAAAAGPGARAVAPGSFVTGTAAPSSDIRAIYPARASWIVGGKRGCVVASSFARMLQPID